MVWMNARGTWSALRVASIAVLAALGPLMGTSGTLLGNRGFLAVEATTEAWAGLPGPPGAISRIAIDPLNPSNVYAVGAGGVRRVASALYWSADAGGNWSPFSNNLDPVEITAVAVRPGTAEVLLGTADGIRRTLDGGRTWLRPNTDLSQSVTVLTIAFVPGRTDYVYALVRDNTKYPASFVYRSNDGGATWKSAQLQQYPNLPAALAIDSATPTTVFASTEGKVYKSADGGASWSAAGGLPISGRIGALAADPSAGNAIYVALQSAGAGPTTIYRSGNAGASWAFVGDVPSTGTVVSLNAVPGSPDALYLATSDDVYRGSSGGRSWQPATNGLESIGISQLVPIGGQQVWVATGDGLYWSNDGGLNWMRRGSGLPVNSHIRTLAAPAGRPGTLYAGLERPAGSQGGAALMKSVDGGNTWQPSNTGPGIAATAAIAVDARSPDTLYAGTYSGLFKSGDGGSRWAKLPLGLQYRAADGTIKNADGAPIVLSLAIDPANPSIVYAGEYNFGLYRSADGGASWTFADLRAAATSTLSVYAIAVDSVNPGRIYAATSTHGLFCTGPVYRSDDRGVTWQRAGDANRGLPACEGRALAIDTANPPNLVVGTAGSGIYRSADGGQTWTAAAGLPANSSILHLLADPARAGTFYAAREGGNVYRSDDGGATWYSISAGLGDNPVRGLAVDPSGQGPLYAATENGGVWRYAGGAAGQNPPPAVDARVEIVWPHGGVPVTEASLANVGARLFMPNSLVPVACAWTPTVGLWASINAEPATRVATGQQRMIDGSPTPYWEFNDIDVSAARDPSNRIYFWVAVDEVPTRSSVWSHGVDARTFFPTQDTPEDVGTITDADAKIELVWPHDRNGQSRGVTDAPLVNVGVDVYQRGTRIAPPLDWAPTLRLWRSLNNGVGEVAGLGQKILVTTGDITYPRWTFNDLDVTAAQDPLNKYYFWATIDGVPSYGNIWSHGEDARTYFPQMDEPISGCR